MARKRRSSSGFTPGLDPSADLPDDDMVDSTYGDRRRHSRFLKAAREQIRKNKRKKKGLDWGPRRRRGKAGRGQIIWGLEGGKVPVPASHEIYEYDHYIRLKFVPESLIAFGGTDMKSWCGVKDKDSPMECTTAEKNKKEQQFEVVKAHHDMVEDVFALYSLRTGQYCATEGVVFVTILCNYKAPTIETMFKEFNTEAMIGTDGTTMLYSMYMEAYCGLPQEPGEPFTCSYTELDDNKTTLWGATLGMPR